MTLRCTSDTGFWTIATDRTVVRRAAKIALIVGTVIALINHGDKMVTGQMSGMAWIKCVLTFLVPYSVSTYSSVMAVRDRLQSLGTD
ncbi:nitrate/nitrite transporter NrtS [uncultured Tateyamaria sp.]|uniref:nitrate/nitrite transporter NrtS n=1 Tax=uncultured Tateyamaria sp. TaxID=455651 RepID=UPI0026199570|nr:nitrate/nitrite transporter NrtS [uncultured Tateyamaria sp.]